MSDWLYGANVAGVTYSKRQQKKRDLEQAAIQRRLDRTQAADLQLRNQQDLQTTRDAFKSMQDEKRNDAALRKQGYGNVGAQITRLRDEGVKAGVFGQPELDAISEMSKGLDAARVAGTDYNSDAFKGYGDQNVPDYNELAAKFSRAVADANANKEARRTRGEGRQIARSGREAAKASPKIVTFRGGQWTEKQLEKKQSVLESRLTNATNVEKSLQDVNRIADLERQLREIDRALHPREGNAGEKALQSLHDLGPADIPVLPTARDSTVLGKKDYSYLW